MNADGDGDDGGDVVNDGDATPMVMVMAMGMVMGMVMVAVMRW